MNLPIIIATKYIGKKEKAGNLGFQDPQMEADMISKGEWKSGYSWCACFMQMIFRMAYPERDAEFKKLFDPSTRQTLENFKAAEYAISEVPVEGALVVWGLYENGVLTWKGHMGIVSKAIDKINFVSIEGNTSGAGSSNGDRVFEHQRSTTKKKKGLNVLAFIIIPQTIIIPANGK